MMMKASKRLLLFDIDGTLLDCGGLGARSLLGTLSKVFERTVHRKDVVFAGRTDTAIINDLMLRNGAAPDDIVCKMEQVWETFPEMMRAEVEELEKDGEARMDVARPRALIGVPELLNILKEEKMKQHKETNVLLGLVTGNMEHTAKIKLASSGIDPSLFPIGAYGCDSHDRNRLPLLALERANSYYHSQTDEEDFFAKADVVVIGDTPFDIECAKVNGLVSVAVATGHHGYDKLKAHHPHLLFHDFSDPQAVAQALLTSSFA
ncbi:Haloacid dehalogenase domain protein hydrolase [Balamuthia mandrillaris]